MYPGHQPGSGRRAAHLAAPRHVCPLQGGHEPGAGLSGETLLSNVFSKTVTADIDVFTDI